MNSVSITVPRFKSIAEFMIKLAQAPQLVRFNLTFDELKEAYGSSIAPMIEKQIMGYESKYDGFNARFSIIQEQRAVSKWLQFKMIFTRNITYLVRNPRTLNAVFFNAFFFGLLILALFWKVGDYTRATTVNQAVGNWIGIAFMLSNSLIFPSLMVVIIQMPVQVPVFKREIMNKMYTPAIYYCARVISGMLLQIFYPIILTLVVYWGLAIDNSFENFFYYLTLSIEINLVGCALGYMAGVSFD